MSAKISLLILVIAFAALNYATRKPAGTPRLDHQFSHLYKGVAMIMVLYHHTGIYHAGELWYLYLSGWLFGGVSLFFFISAYGLMASFERNQYSYSEYVKKRLLTLWPLIILCMAARWGFGPLMTIRYAPMLNPLYLLGLLEWYILAIAVYYALFILIRRQTRRTGDTIFAFFTVTLCLWAGLDLFSEASVMAKQWLRFPFSFFMGILFWYYAQPIMDYLASRLIPVTLSAALMFGLSIHVHESRELVYPLLDLIFPVIGLCLVHWMYRFNAASNFLIWTGKASLPLYLLQVPLIKYGVFLCVWRTDALGVIVTWSVIYLLPP